MKSWKAIAVVAALFVGLAASSANAAEPPPGEACEIHVWQTELYGSTTGAPYLENTILGDLLQGDPDKKYPVGSAVDQLKLELGLETVEPLIAALPWGTYTAGHPVRIVMERQIANPEQLKQLKKATKRNTDSVARCYLEIYIDKQIFQGGMIKSWLFSTLKVRSFDGPKPKLVNSITYAHAPNFPAKDEASIPEARESIRAAFAQNLASFFEKKIAKKKS